MLIWGFAFVALTNFSSRGACSFVCVCFCFCVFVFVFLFFQEMMSTLGGEKTRKIMDSQGFKMPLLFTQKAGAMSFLEKNGLWACHPGLFVSGMVEPKLGVRRVCVCVPPVKLSLARVYVCAWGTSPPQSLF